MKIRTSYCPADAERVYPLLVEFGRAARLAEPFSTQEEFCAQWESLVKLRTACTILAEEDEKVVGCLGMLFSPRVYWAGHMAAETFFWVKPSCRGSLTAARLLREFETEARRRGCEVVHVGHKSHFRAEEMERFYKKFGYRSLEVMYQKDL